MKKLTYNINIKKKVLQSVQFNRKTHTPKVDNRFNDKLSDKEMNYNDIKVVKVSAKNSSKEHPATGEIEKVNDREVRFSTDQVIDRDQLAGLNLALRRPKEEAIKIKQLNKRKEKKITRLSRQSNFKKIKNTAISDKKINKKENVKTVMFSHDKATNSYAIVIVFCVSQNNCYKDNNIHFIHIYDNFTQ